VWKGRIIIKVSNKDERINKTIMSHITQCSHWKESRQWHMTESSDEQAMKRTSYHARNQEMGHTMKKRSRAQIML
jgi:hypothetical protein